MTSFYDFRSIVLGVAGSLLMIVPSGHFISLCLLLALSIYVVLVRWNLISLRKWPKFIWLSVLYAIVSSIVMLFNGEEWRTLNQVQVFFYVPILFLIFDTLNINSKLFYGGLALTLILGLVIAIYQVALSSQVVRADGFAKNPIWFGGISVVISGLCLCGILIFSEDNRWFKSLLFFGFLCGIGAALLSGSKGCWLAAASVLPWPILRCLNRYSIKTNFIFFAFLILVVGATVVMPNSPVLSRYESLGRYVESGSDEGSLYPRIAMWKYVFQFGAFLDPVTGVSQLDMWESQVEVIQKKLIPEFTTPWHHMHNDLLNIYLERGIFGLATFVLILSSLFIYFIKSFQSKGVTSAHGFSGLIMMMNLLVLMQTETMLRWTAPRETFVFLILVVSGFVYNSGRKLSEVRTGL